MHRLGWFISLSLLIFTFRAVAQPNRPGKPRELYPYLTYVPKLYANATRTYPLLIYLHGGSLRGRDLKKLETYGPPYFVKQGRNYPFILASPQCPDGKFWSTDDWMTPLLAELKQKYRVDTSRIYVTGVSMGGYGAWQVAMDNPRLFAAVVPLCGGCDDSTQICRIRHVPAWAFHGAADDQIPVSETDRLVRRLHECDGHVRYTRLANQGHDLTYLYRKRSLYRWMLKHRN